jgi:chaperonin cofactor prefoldin
MAQMRQIYKDDFEKEHFNERIGDVDPAQNLYATDLRTRGELGTLSIKDAERKAEQLKEKFRENQQRLRDKMEAEQEERDA